jgi:hypothetical protein
VLLHRLGLAAGSGGPACHGPLVKAKRDHDGLQGTAVSYRRSGLLLESYATCWRSKPLSSW